MATRDRGCGGTSGSTFGASLSISQTPYRASRYSAESQNPRARVVARLNRSPPIRKSAYASPPGVSFLVSDLHRRAVSRHAPPQRGASPNHQRAGCPRVALPRVKPRPRRWPIHGNTEALFRSLRLPAQILCEIYAAKAAGKSKPCPSRRRDRHPILCRLPGTL